MKFLWTRSTILGGKQDLITWGLEEPVGHFAIEFNNGDVFHSSLYGVELIRPHEFYKHRVKILELAYEVQDDSKIRKKLSEYLGYKYDWVFFFWLVWVALKLKLFRIPIPNKIKRQQNGGILCTEAVNLLPIEHRPDIDLSRVTTPYKLYNILLEKQKGG